MAKLIDLLTFSGAVNDMVGCRGTYGFYVRKRPRRSHKDPTPKQLEARERLSMVVAFLKPLKEMIYDGFGDKRRTGGRTQAMNAATSHVLNHAVTGTYPELHIDPAEVRLSRGGLPGLVQAGAMRVGNTVVVNWSPDMTPESGFPDDLVRAVVYNPSERTVMTGMVSRETGTLTVNIADETPGSELLVYVCVSDRDGKVFANSQFLGRMTR